MTTTFRTPAVSLVDDLRVASPCFEAWAGMAEVAGEASDRVRHCARCDRHVYNVSALARDEAEVFLRERTGQRTCVRFFRRDDDTVVTKDCPMTRSQRRVVLKTIVVTAAVSAGVAGTALVADELSAQRLGSPSEHGIVVEAARVLHDVGFGRASQGAMTGIRSD